MQGLKHEGVRTELVKQLTTHLNQYWTGYVSLQEKWESLVNSTLIEAAQQILSAKTTDWFLENERIVRPAVEKKKF